MTKGQEKGIAFCELGLDPRLQAPARKMIYLFLDETYQNLDIGKRFTICCISTLQENWKMIRHKDYNLKTPLRMDKLNRLATLLSDVKSIGLVTYADINKKYMPPKKRDDTLDIKQMSRIDNIWSVIFAFAIAHAQISLLNQNFNFQTIDVYYDQQILKAPHQNALESALRINLKRVTKEFNLDISIRHIIQVNKNKIGDAPSIFQIGTNLAHFLCSYSNEMIDKNTIIPNNIEIINSTPYVETVFNKYL